MNREKTSVVVLGAGPAGLGAAWRLASRRDVEVTLLERSDVVGGNAGSFELAGIPVDFGSHRLHPACDSEILEDIRRFLGEDLLDRPRHGRILLQGRWIHFPLKPIDLALRLPPSFAANVATDLLLKPFRADAGGADESFASVLRGKLGPTITRDFYLPYARKIWGVDPGELSPIQARRRVSADSPVKLARKVLGAVPGLRPPGAGRFYYPRRGFGQISEAYHRAAAAAGARVLLNATVEAVDLAGGRVAGVGYRRTGRSETVAADHVWSTIPITTLARCLRPGPPPAVLEAAGEIDYRSMILVYLVLARDRFTEYDAHYFPDAEVPMTRISEPKNYSLHRGASGRTVLCAEVPCSTGDPEWSADDESLGRLVRGGLKSAGLGDVEPERVVTRRLPQAYPIYRTGYEVAFDRLDDWLSKVPNVLSFGRQGLFAHDNTHHALFMAYSAASCLSPEGGFDTERWQGMRRVFETHVVED